MGCTQLIAPSTLEALIPTPAVMSFGKSFRSHFPHLDPAVTPLNHGSFGLTPGCVTEQQKRVCETQEGYSDRFHFSDAERIYAQQIQALARYLHLDPRNLAFVTNATCGVNTVLRSIKWDFSRDRVLLHSVSYAACANTVKFLADYYGLQYDVVKLDYPLEDDDLLARFHEKLATGSYRLCMFDMISSMPGVKLPYEQLIQLCKQHDVLSLVDGAHGAGLVDLQFLDTLQPDFMTTNLHKWLNAPKSCGMLYVNPKHHATIQSLPISWNYSLQNCQYIPNPTTAEDRLQNESLMHNKFWFAGTISYAQYFSVEEAIKFREETCGGEDRIREYQWQLQRDAVPLVLAEFGPGAKLLQNSTNTLAVAGMFNVSLPLSEKYSVLKQKLVSDVHYFQNFREKCAALMFSRKAFLPLVCHNGELWVRFSVQVYNELEDYRIGARSVKSAVAEVLDAELSA
ncbi:LAQU0S01e15324g1_1 [Lachancea quebecensis]|uniref:LAQU0S01e15324g1_1 n=1 Tax=Lachancea quebecensis TaxID=1654605 RepID=A0A0P1KQ49_9SACH|nr:LAQU0S01e15324g1_1 [Lachancea quebecensis]